MTMTELSIVASIVAVLLSGILALGVFCKEKAEQINELYSDIAEIGIGEDEEDVYTEEELQDLAKQFYKLFEKDG